MATAIRDARTVEQVMSGQFAFCFPNTSLAQAARMMAQNRVYELPVIVDQRCLGYVSYLDILQRYGSLDAATNHATQYAESARRAICHFPDSENKRALLWAPDFVVAREK